MIAKIYMKGYKRRPGVFLLGVVLFIFSFIIFFGNHNALDYYSTQINLLHNSSFRYGYILNYRIGLDNEFAFSDTDIVLYKDNGGNSILPISCYMELLDVDYNSESLIKTGMGHRLSNSEIALTNNTIKSNGLTVGDIIWADFPNKKDLIALTVVSTNIKGYDLFENSMLNIGLGVLGFNEEYLTNISCQYIVFSSESLSSVLANYPQALKAAFAKSDIVFNSLRQLLLFSIIYLFLIVGSEIFYGFVFKASVKILNTMQRKGYEKKNICKILLGEFFLILFIPLLLGAIVWGIVFLQGIAGIYLMGIICGIVIMSSIPLFISRLKKYEVIG